MAAKKIHATTQKFTEIVDFVDNVVVLDGGAACMIIEITASNFALLSRREQDTRIFAYASLLNSLSFPIQILIRNKRIDISIYLKSLDEIIAATLNPQLKQYITYYRTFVHEMVTVNVVLSKSFYIVIPYSALEGGVAGVKSSVQKGQSQAQLTAADAKKALNTKSSTLLGQLQKFATSARVLEKEDLIKLFYDIYNESTQIEIDQVEPGIQATMVTQAKK
jgi:hypothetical protein